MSFRPREHPAVDNNLSIFVGAFCLEQSPPPAARLCRRAGSPPSSPRRPLLRSQFSGGTQGRQQLQHSWPGIADHLFLTRPARSIRRPCAAAEWMLAVAAEAGSYRS